MCSLSSSTSTLLLLFFFNDPATTEIYTLSLHDALPICLAERGVEVGERVEVGVAGGLPGLEGAARVLEAWQRSEEHTSELQSLRHLVCRLLLEKKKKKKQKL